MTIQLPKLRREYQWTFVVAEVTTALLGNDFLSQNALLVDCAKGTLIDSTTLLQQVGTPVAQTTAYLVNDLSHLPPSVRPLLAQHASVLEPRQPT